MQHQIIYRPYKDNHVVDPNRPIFYIIQHVPSGKYYAGYKSNRKSFMTEGGYCTSSKVVNEIISNEGLSTFRIMKIRYFHSGVLARNYEFRFLKRMQVPHNPTFYNRCSNSHHLGIPGQQLSSEHRNAISLSMKGLVRGSMTDDHKEKLRLANLGKKASYETRRKMCASHKGITHTEESKKRMREIKLESPMVYTQEMRKKMSLAKLGKPGKPPWNKGKVFNRAGGFWQYSQSHI